MIIAIVSFAFVIPDAEALPPSKSHGMSFFKKKREAKRGSLQSVGQVANSDKTIGLAAAESGGTVRPRIRGGRNAPRFSKNGLKRHSGIERVKESNKTVGPTVVDQRSAKPRRYFRGGRSAPTFRWRR